MRLLICLVAVAAVCAISLATGTIPLSPAHVWQGLLGNDAQSDVNLIMRDARLPRLLLALTVGSALAVAGLLMQTLCGNPLATPTVLGIGNGANLALVSALVLRPNLSEPTAVLASFCGAVASASIISFIGLSRRSGFDRDRLVVGGTVLGALEGSLLIAIFFFWGMSNTMLGWTLGRLVQVDWSQLKLTVPIICIVIVVVLAFIRPLEAFLLGDTAATSIGVRVGVVQFGTLLAVVLLSSAAVAAAGPIPYVGLIVPHLFPRSQVSKPVARLLLSVVGGAILTALAELLSRLTSQRQSVPAGIWTMAAGAIFFLTISFSRKERHGN